MYQKKFSKIAMIICLVIVVCSPAVLAEDTQQDNNTISQQSQPMIDNGSMNTEKENLKNEETVDSWMPDPILQQAVAQELQITDPAALTKNDMKQLTSLIFTEERQEALSSLQGLEYAENLYYLYIPKSQVQSIDPLAHLSKMEVLYVMFSQVTDLSPLRGMSKMRNLHVDANPITDYSPIAELTNLEEFGARYSGIQDASFLENSPGLHSVFLWDNKIQDVSFLQNLNQLQVLELSYNQIQDDALPLIAQKSQLTQLYLGGNNLTNVEALQQLDLLQNITLHNNHIRDLSPLGQLPNLTNADARYQTIVLDAVVTNQQFLQTSPVVNGEGHVVPITPTGENSEVGTPQNADILWTDLQDTGTFHSQWDDPSLGSKFYFSGTIVQDYENQQDAAPVTVKYQDETGNRLADEEVLNGKIGESYQTDAKDILGWRLKKTPDNAAGHFSKEAQEVIYLYEKEIVPPENDGTDQENTPPDEKKVTQPDTSHPNKDVLLTNRAQPQQKLAKVTNTTLPQTGDQQDSLYWLMGSICIVISGCRLKKRL
ncbi:MucBP domain-containing protein [Listeria ilorinensis]|uniref:MucBP domain-containing protein n=1 Tax=Listeria ilorinensis TaxID=2867439 RepID=UPI001EF5A80E|nr:MucBP domain-containing protein [Listeria ilorinensis]